MKVHTGTSLQRLRNPVISIGVFDGIHKGHAAIFRRVIDRAGEMEGESAIITFWPHPRLVLGKNPGQLKFLTTMEEKKELIKQHGIDHLFILEFTKEFSRLPACRFVKQYLVDGAGLRHLVFGFDHHFGHRREGNYENLKSCAKLYGFTLEQLEPVQEGTQRISSSVIREALLGGDVKLAAGLLSYPYSLEGQVIEGKKVGRGIGFPTANIEVIDKHKLIPSDGVYAVEAIMGKKVYRGMMNIGFRPTINSKRNGRTMETHIFDFRGDIYNRNITVRFIDRIRDEKQFDSIESLQEQLRKDMECAISILNG